MAESRPLKETIVVDFKMATDEGTQPLRSTAEHAHAVGEAWVELGRRMRQLADSFDQLSEAEGEWVCRADSSWDEWCVVDDCPATICQGPHFSHMCRWGDLVTSRASDKSPCPWCGHRNEN